MPWELEIHHIDVTSSGDATIIVARHLNPPLPPLVRTVLIDSGKGGATAGILKKAEVVHNYLVNLNPPNGNPVNVIVVTHFDNDHFSGIPYLLNRAGTTIYNNAVIYDPGQPPNKDCYYSGNPVRDNTDNILWRRPTKDYLRYIDAINKKPNIIRATLLVNSFDIVRYNLPNHHQISPPVGLAIPGPPWLDAYYYNGVLPVGAAAGVPHIGGRAPIVGQASLPPDWLVGREIMWGNGGDGQAGRPAFAQIVPAPPAGFPRLTCISANKWTLQPGVGNPNSFVSDANIFNGPRMPDNEIRNVENGFNPDGSGSPKDNPKSLGFLLQFNNFKYYIAGDLETPQEDGANNTNSIPVVFKNGVANFINQNDTIAGRVLVMKTSHHGADTATSRQFVTRLRPSAAMISCSSNKQYGHPASKTINVLDGYEQQPINYKNAIFQVNAQLQKIRIKHPNLPPPPPNKPVIHYLTGFIDPKPGQAYAVHTFRSRTLGGDVSYTAGCPLAPPQQRLGHIKVLVSHNESNTPVHGLLYRGLLATINNLNANFHMNLPVLQITSIAENGATFGIYKAVASAIGANVGSAIGAIEAAAYVGKNDTDGSIIEVAGASANLAAAILNITPLITLKANLIVPPKVNPLGVGIAQAIANTVFNQTAVQITADVNATIGANVVAATAAGHAGFFVRQNIGNIFGGYAAAAAMGAVYGALAAGITSGQATAIAAAIGVETAGAAVTVNLMVDTVYDAAIAAGLANNSAVLAAAVAAVCFFGGQPVEVQNIVSRALQRGGAILIPPATFATEGAAARDATNLMAVGGTNDLFRVEFHDDNPAYTGIPGAANPRTITHTS